MGCEGCAGARGVVEGGVGRGAGLGWRGLCEERGKEQGGGGKEEGGKDERKEEEGGEEGDAEGKNQAKKTTRVKSKMNTRRRQL